MNPEKAPYSPPEDKRFEVSRDSISRERLEVLKRLNQELEAELPEYAGTTFFGSLSKGRPLTTENAPETDVDLNIWINRDMLVREFPSDSKRPPEIQESFEKYKGIHANSAHYDDSQFRFWAVRDYVKRKIKEDFGDTKTHGDPDEVMEWSGGKLNETLFGKGAPAHDTEYQEAFLKHIARIFHLNIGNRINQYRVDLLLRLKEKGEWGQERWKQILDKLISIERLDRFQRPYSETWNDEQKKKELRPLYPPEDLDEALAYFGYKKEQNG